MELALLISTAVGVILALLPTKSEVDPPENTEPPDAVTAQSEVDPPENTEPPSAVTAQSEVDPPENTEPPG